MPSAEFLWWCAPSMPPNQSIVYSFPVLIRGPCASVQSFQDAAVTDKYKFVSSCGAPWPCASGAKRLAD